MQTYPPGTRIGQYEIASRPMMGGMGVVYFALDHGNDGRPVAIKTFRPELLPDRAARDRFLREGTAWVDLGNHPHIVRCYKVEYIDPTTFLVLELIAKEQNMPDASLRSWLIPGQPLPIEQALLFALQIARGMQYATEKIPGFVHRDLKPENILVGADRLSGTNINRLRVTDFGLVKTIADSHTPTPISNPEELKPNQIQFTRGVGTPLYMAPEQWKGEPVGAFTDVYAFGCILFEILSGQTAVNGKTITELQVSHCDGKLQLTPSNLPKYTENLLAKCLVTNPGQRFGNWSELINAIEHAYLNQSGVSVPNATESAESSRDEKMRTGWSYNAIGLAYKDIGKANIALDYFDTAHMISREIGDRLGESVALGNLGLVYAQLGDAKRAIAFHEQKLDISREIGDQHGQGSAYGNLGTAFAQLGDLQGAIGYYEKTLEIYRKIGDRHREGMTLGSIGEAYRNLGNTQNAIVYQKQRLDIAREVGDRRGEGNALSNIGAIYLDLRDTQLAFGYIDQSLNIRHEIGDRRGEANDLSNLGALHLVLDEAGEAIGYYEKALKIFREVGDRRGEGIALGNLGIAYQKLGDLEHTIEYYEQQMAIFRDIGDLSGIGTVSLNIALFYFQLGDVSRAIPLAQEAASIFTKIGHTTNAQRAEQLIAQHQNDAIPAQLNAAQAAFESFQRADSSQDMQVAITKYPFIIDNQFVQAIEEIIKEQIPSEHKPAFEQRLTWLRQIAAQK